MRRVHFSKVVLLTTLSLAPQLNAIGLGDANLHSWLGEPLDVLIPIIESGNLGSDDIRVQQVFGERARKLNLNDAISDDRYIISTETDSNDQLWVKARSRIPISEPYISFTLQIEMPGGTVSREYTLLIDLPPKNSDKRKLGQPANNNETQATYSLELPELLATSYQVLPTDTLGEIAQKIRPNLAIKLQALIQTLFNDNPNAFEQGDINRLISGVHLNLPNAAQYKAMPRRSDLIQKSNGDVKSTLPIQNSQTTTPIKPIQNKETGGRGHYYTVVAGDTLSQIAQAVRPDQSIPLASAIKTLLEHNQELANSNGNRLDIGDKLQVPHQNIFFANAGLIVNKDEHANHQVSTASNSQPEADKKPQDNIATQRDNTKAKLNDTPPPEQQLFADLKALQQTTSKVSEKLQALQPAQIETQLTTSTAVQNYDKQQAELLTLINQVLDMQQKQFVISQQLVELQSQVNTDQSQTRAPTQNPIEISSNEKPSSSSLQNNFLIGLIIALSTLAAFLLKKLYWLPYTLNRTDVKETEFTTTCSKTSSKTNKSQPAKPEPQLDTEATPAIKPDTNRTELNAAASNLPTPSPAQPNLTENQTLDFNSLFDSEAANQPQNSELDLHFDLDIDIPEDQQPDQAQQTPKQETENLYSAYKPALANSAFKRKKTSAGEAAAQMQNQKDYELHQKLAARRLEPRRDNPNPNNTDSHSASMELDEIFQPSDLEIFTGSDALHSDTDSNIIWQANIYSAYGQLSKAETLLANGLKENTESIALKLALLDIYARSNQLQEFELLCQQIPKESEGVTQCIDDCRKQFNIPTNSEQ